MTSVWYTSTKKLNPSIGDDWSQYVRKISLPQLREIISLDTTLRPKELWELNDEDWLYNIHMDYLIAYFWDLDYLLKRFASKRSSVNILAVMLEPSSEVQKTFGDERFSFQGYDLIGESVSVLNHCGNFEKAFLPSDISEVGLLNSYDLVRKVQRRLRQEYSDESHTDCTLWAIWKMTSW